MPLPPPRPRLPHLPRFHRHPAAFCILHSALLILHCVRGAAADAWPEFRGPTAEGHAPATATALPLEWSPTQNIAWKQPVPGTGWSSPVVARGRVFLTTGVTTAPHRASLRALALDAATGRILWNTELVPDADLSPRTIHKKNSPASPTAVIDGDRLYIHFGHHGTACLDLDGNILWRATDFAYDPLHGNGSSPLLAGDHLVFTADGTKAPAVIALDKTTGKLAWKFSRTINPRQTFSFCTPLLIDVAPRPSAPSSSPPSLQLIAPGAGAVSALDPATGRELWHVKYGNGYSVVPRPVYAHGLLFVATGYNRADLLAIRVDPGATGDLTDTHIAWRTTKGAPLTPSVLVVGDELYAVNDAGLATCWDAKTGQVHWQEKIEGNYSASPLHAAGRIYFQNETGATTILAAKKTFEKLATNQLDERTLASHAVLDRAILLRTADHLYRIETPR